MADAASERRGQTPGAIGAAVLVLVLVLGAARAAQAETPSPWSDSERLGDLVYFGAYGGVSFASVGELEHTSKEDGSIARVADLTAPVSFSVAYDLAWWPYDFFGLGSSFEVFGLPLQGDQDRFDSCVGDGCRQEKLPSYEGFGMQVGPTVRGAVPLRYLQPNLGVGMMLPVTFLFTQDPVSRLNQTAWDVGAALRLLGGINFFVARDWRIFGEYHLDYRFATINPGAPLETTGWLRQSAVIGFSASPEDFKAEPSGDKTTDVVVPFVVPLAGWAVAAVAKGVAK
jgi:hypothetical protein